MRYLTLKQPWPSNKFGRDNYFTTFCYALVDIILEYLTFTWPWPWYLSLFDLEVTLIFDLQVNPLAGTRCPCDHTLFPFPFIPSTQEPHLCLYLSSLQQPHALPVPFIPLTPIPRRTTPFASTLHPYYPIQRTTPFISSLLQSDHTMLPHPHKNHTICLHVHPYYPTHYPISRRTKPFDSTLHPSNLTLLLHPHKNHTLCSYPSSLLSHPKKNHTLCWYHPSLLHYPRKNHTFVGTLIPITLPITTSAEEPHLSTVPWIPLTSPCYPIPTRITPFADTLHLYYPIPQEPHPLLVHFIPITLSQEPHPLLVTYTPLTTPIYCHPTSTLYHYQHIPQFVCA